MMPKCATAGVWSTRVMEVRRRSIAEWQIKGEIVERRAEGLTQKGHKGTYEKGLISIQQESFQHRRDRHWRGAVHDVCDMDGWVFSRWHTFVASIDAA